MTTSILPRARTLRKTPTFFDLDSQQQETALGVLEFAARILLALDPERRQRPGAFLHALDLAKTQSLRGALPVNPPPVMYLPVPAPIALN